ncbi:DUF3025 domain-containing protein [Xylophilus ampelinus]|uniref:DUF3025 domain-containing protein n=1 Tax=Xylophilus ampelinus TaxID=54067 RepID=UPI000D7BBCB0
MPLKRPAALAGIWQTSRTCGTPMRPSDSSPSTFVPPPVVGVPGCWPANEAPASYDDPRVFRPARVSAGA